MSRWRSLQKELIQKAISNEKLDIIQSDISSGRVHGTIYYKKGVPTNKGILLAHGFSGNRYGLGVLAERLAAYGYFCLSIDVPSHFLNPSKFTMGELSETITEGVMLLKRQFGMQRVAVVAHSIGAIGSLFANAGYNTQIESGVYVLWDEIAKLIEEEGQLIISKTITHEKMQEINRKIEDNYEKLRNLILFALKQKIQNNSDVTCYVLLSSAMDAKSAIPGLNMLRKLKFSWLKKVVTKVIHEPSIKQGFKEGNIGKYEPINDPKTVEMQFFKTQSAYEFMDYFLSMKEPKDFLQLVEDIIKFRHKDEKTGFFEYYQKKYLLSKPKLFIYGTKDLLLKPFMPFMRRRLEKFYESCGNAEIHHLPLSHLLLDNPAQHISFMVAKNARVTELILRFLDRNN